MVLLVPAQSEAGHPSLKDEWGEPYHAFPDRCA